MRRIDPRPRRVGAGLNPSDPENLEELEVRRERHHRLTRGQPRRPFSAVLAERRRGEAEPEAAEAPTPPSRGAIEPHLGLAPQQARSLALPAPGRPGHRSAKVIVKG